MGAFKIGDRVIHTQNKSNLVWYSNSTGKRVFVPILDSDNRAMHGVYNGDVGRIVDIMPRTSANIEALSSDDVDSNCRDESSWYVNDAYFIVVEYYDACYGDTYNILYRATEFDDNSTSKIFNLTGEDLDMLTLFYAGTCHKLQGSQNSVIIVLLGSVKYNSFITRNMLYTMVTRASGCVYLVGSVSNDYNSTLTKARKLIAGDSVYTLDTLIDAKE